MSDDNNISDDDLAAEYVTGVLEGNDRARAQKRIDTDINFARLVSQWEERLSPLNVDYDEVKAPAHIKAAIDDKLFVEAPKGEQSAGGFGMLGFMTKFRIPILLAVLIFAATPRVMDYFNQNSAPEILYTANIAPLESYNVSFSAQISDNGISIQQTGGDILTDKDFELWLVRSDGQVLTLGVLSGQLNPNDLEIEADSKFAVSIEPLGGSPTGVATGPVVALGALVGA